MRVNHDSLLSLDLVPVELVGGGRLDEGDSVCICDLFENGIDLGCGVWSLSFLVLASGVNGGGEHHAVEELSGVVGCEEKVCLRRGGGGGFPWCGGHNDSGADDGGEPVDMCAKLDLDDLPSFEGFGGFGGVSRERTVGGNDVGRGDGCGECNP